MIQFLFEEQSLYRDSRLLTCFTSHNCCNIYNIICYKYCKIDSRIFVLLPIIIFEVL